MTDMRVGRFALLPVAVVLALAAPNAAQARYQGDFNLFVGQKWLKHSDWDPVAEQPEIGLMLAFGEERAPVHFSLDLFMSKDETPFVDPVLGAVQKRGSSLEFTIGVRKTFGHATTRPHIAAGADVISARLDTTSASGLDSREDRGFGAFIEAGVSWRIAKHVNLGIDARYSKANVDLGSRFFVEDATAGGFHAGLLLGYGW